MKLFTLLLLLSLTACASKYSVTINADGSGTFESTSYRKFDSIKVEYKGFKLQAKGVSDDTGKVVIELSDTVSENLSWFLKSKVTTPPFIDGAN